MMTVVTGPPCSGKSTYVTDHAKPGDIIVDADAICRALQLGLSDGHHASEDAMSLAIAARSAVVTRLLLSPLDRDSWVIHTQPTWQQVAAYRHARAQVVTLDPGREVCLERAGRLRPWAAPIIEAWYGAG